MLPIMQDHYTLIRPELIVLCTRWGLWKSLFMDGDAVERLNQVSGVAAGSIQDSLFRDIALTLARLLDPPQQGRNENASVQQLTGGELPEELEAIRKRVAAIRNKRLAHNDAPAMREETRLHYGFTDEDVDDAIARVTQIVNEAECAATDATTCYEYVEEQGKQAGARFVQGLVAD